MDISKFNKCRVLVVGDLIIDEYVWGEVNRISPEAPVQIVSVKNEGFTLGGPETWSTTWWHWAPGSPPWGLPAREGTGDSCWKS